MEPANSHSLNCRAAGDALNNGTDTNTYLYDAEGRLSYASNPSGWWYQPVYNALGQRVATHSDFLCVGLSCQIKSPHSEEH